MLIDPRQTWSTPKDFYSVIDAEFHPTIDVAATEQNTKCTSWIPPHTDALSNGMRWLPGEHRVAWCNPGFADMLPWFQKAYKEVCAYGGCALVLGLVSPSTEWWKFYIEHCVEIRLIGGRRIQFDPAEGVKRSSNARENALFIFRKRPDGGQCHQWTWDWVADYERIDNAARMVEVAI